MDSSSLPLWVSSSAQVILPSWVPVWLLIAVAALCTVQLITFLRFSWFHGYNIPGPWFLIKPFWGGVNTWRTNEEQFWSKQRERYCRASSGEKLCPQEGQKKNGKSGKNGTGIVWAPIYSNFAVHVEDPQVIQQLTRECEAAEREGGSPLFSRRYLCPMRNGILGQDSQFMLQSGATHANIRSTLRSVLSAEALQPFLPVHEKCIRDSLVSWSFTASLRSSSAALTTTPPTATAAPQQTVGGADSSSKLSPSLLFHLTADTVLEVLLGPFGDDRQYALLKENYLAVEKGLRAIPRIIPLYFPGTTLYRAIEARKTLVQQLESVISFAVNLMTSEPLPEDAPPSVLETWLPLLVEMEKATAGEKRISYSQAAEVIFSVWFGAQEGLVPALEGLVALLREDEEKFKLVFDEQRQVQEHYTDPITITALQQMKNTRKVVREYLCNALVVKPVPLWMDQRDYSVTDSANTVRVLKKGTCIVPSLRAFCAANDHGHGGLTPRASSSTCSSTDETEGEMKPSEQQQQQLIGGPTTTAYGVGPHACLGQSFSEQFLVVFLALAVGAKDPTLKRLLWGFGRVEENALLRRDGSGGGSGSTETFATTDGGSQETLGVVTPTTTSPSIAPSPQSTPEKSVPR